MIRRWFYQISIALLAGLALISLVWPPVWWLLVLIGPIIAIGLYDVMQSEHAILRNFPVIGHIRYWLERIRPEIQQYFIESNIDAHPIPREIRAIVYQRAKGALETKPFGTERDVYRVGYEWAAHALSETEPLKEEPRVVIGGEQCRQPYSSSVLNISAMSYGALSPAAIKALNKGAKKGGFAHNTGEGGVSPYHLEAGADLIWQIGTAYFGCRTRTGDFDPEMFKDMAQRDEVRMIELKLSQGAKPGHGGVLPACKVNEELAEIRKVPMGEDVISPPRHRAFHNPTQMLEFITHLRELSGGKPVGFKLSVGRRVEFLSICKAILETGVTPDFITVDGGEGGTGAAPLEFSNSLGMPARDAWMFVNNALVGVGKRDHIRLIASGKIMTGFHMIRAMALGADLCNSARGMMFALGCVQSLRCNKNTCPTGIATQDPWLYKGLVVEDKAERVFRFHQGSIHSFLDLMNAMGVDSLSQISPELIFRRIGDMRVETFAELYEFLTPGQLLDDDDLPRAWARDWRDASATAFAP
ncbi:FMN-binding glutamate synthase family protein [Hahella sp. NBU794]|uniref:FMN-binding glutamate synthase family protein n=1 Tax=Hahella sp. NBU794 TaxID=3422590 RepID=UPI003D70075E